MFMNNVSMNDAKEPLRGSGNIANPLEKIRWKIKSLPHCGVAAILEATHP